jgi:predicted outer membrane repeat protein
MPSLKVHVQGIGQAKCIRRYEIKVLMAVNMNNIVIWDVITVQSGKNLTFWKNSGTGDGGSISSKMFSFPQTV